MVSMCSGCLVPLQYPSTMRRCRLKASCLHRLPLLGSCCQLVGKPMTEPTTVAFAPSLVTCAVSIASCSSSHDRF